MCVGVSARPSTWGDRPLGAVPWPTLDPVSLDRLSEWLLAHSRPRTNSKARVRDLCASLAR
jgi:hypothetical protein